MAHAQDIVSRLLEAVIDAARGSLTLSKLEGDAAFFYVCYRAGEEPDLSFVSNRIERIYHAFHDEIADLKARLLCPCDGCTQAAELKIKFTGHFGEAAVQRIRRSTELAGIDVILVHRMLKNDVPVPEYLLITEPVLRRVGEVMRQRACACPLDLEDLGLIDAHFVDLAGLVGDAAPKPRRSLPIRLLLLLAMEIRSLPYLLRLRKPCGDFQNVSDSLADAGPVEKT